MQGESTTIPLRSTSKRYGLSALPLPLLETG
jgi:hypothetical protein